MNSVAAYCRQQQQQHIVQKPKSGIASVKGYTARKTFVEENLICVIAISIYMSQNRVGIDTLLKKQVVRGS